MNTLSGNLQFEKELNETEKGFLKDFVHKGDQRYSLFFDKTCAEFETEETFSLKKLELLRKFFEDSKNPLVDGCSIVFEDDYGFTSRFFLENNEWNQETNHYLSDFSTEDLIEEIRRRQSAKEGKKSYTFVFHVEGNAKISVKASSIPEGFVKSNIACSETDFGELSNIEWVLHHVEDEDGNHIMEV